MLESRIAISGRILNILVVKKEHPVNAPIGLGREAAREYCRFVNTFTKPSILKILVVVGYGVGGQSINY